MDRIEKGIFCGLLLLAGLLAALLLSGHEGLFGTIGGQKEPFITDRVVPVRIRMAAKDWQWILANPMVEQYVRADFWFDGHKYPNVAVRAKGNSSLMAVAGSGSRRMSLKVDFNFFNSAQNFCGLKKLCLNNGFSDPTFIREVLGYELFEQMDIPAPRCAFVDLYINDLHLGLYTQVEPIDKAFLTRHFSNPNGNLYKPEIGAATLNWTREDWEKQKVNSTDPQRQPPQKDKPAINIGGSRLSDLLGLLEREKALANPDAADQSANLSEGPFAQGPFPGGFGPGGGPFAGGFPPPFGMNRRFGPDPNGFAAGPDGRGGPGRGFRGFGGPGGPGFGGRNLLETVGLKTNENYPNYTALFQLLEVINNYPDESFPEQIEKVLDVDQVLRYLAVSVLIVHLDNYIGMGHNYYLYEIDGRFTILPWDLNMAFGTFRMGVFQQEITEFFIDDLIGSMGDRPLVRRLFAHPPYLDQYHRYLEQLLEGGFAEGAIESRIDRWIALIRPYVEQDELKFFTMDDFEKGITEGSSGAGWMRPPGGTGATSRMPAIGMDPPFGGPADPTSPRDQNQQRRLGGFSRRGPGGPGGGGPGGMGAPGLKSFISKRRISVRKQLDGQAPSVPTAEQRQQGSRGFFMMPPGGMR